MALNGDLEMSASSPTIEQFRKELLLIKLIYMKLFTFATNEDKCKAAGYDYYYHYTGRGDGDYINHVYNIGYDHHNPKIHHYTDYLCLDISKHSEKVYCIRATFEGEIFKNFRARALKHYNKIITTDILEIFSEVLGAYWEVGDLSYFVRSCFETTSNNPAKEFDPISVIKDMKIGFGYTYLYPDAGIGISHDKADMSALTVERLSLFNNLLDDFIKGVKNNTYIT